MLHHHHSQYLSFSLLPLSFPTPSLPFPSLPFFSSSTLSSLSTPHTHTHTTKKKTTSAPANKSCQALSQRHSPRRPQHRPVQLKAVGLLLLVCRGVVVVGAIGLYHHSTIDTIDSINDVNSISISIISINTIAVDADALCSD